MATRTRRRTTAKKTTRKAAAKRGGSAARRSTTRTRSSGRSGGTTATRRRSTGRRTTRRGASSRSQLRERHVSEVMSGEPITIIESEPVVAAARMMRENDIGNVIVLGDTDGRVRGIVTDRDIVVRAVADEREPGQTTVGAICSDELVTVAPDDTVDSALALMRRRAVRRIPVCDDGRAVGVLSIGDLAERFDERSALADISSAPPND
jgi:signal-transduction protein with cAMP-binding, CBS, and nucleotidyltransferase domain